MRQLDEAQALVQGCNDRWKAAMTAQLDECQAVLDHFDSVCRGCIEVHCDQAEQIIAKVLQKVDDHLVYWLLYLYNLLARFGVRQPTQDELTARANGQVRPWPGETPQPDTSTLPEVEEPYIPPPAVPSPQPAPQPVIPPEMPSATPAPGSGAMVQSGGQPPDYPAPAPKTQVGCVQWDVCDEGIAFGWFRWAWRYLAWWAAWLFAYLVGRFGWWWKATYGYTGNAQASGPFGTSTPAGEPVAQFPLEKQAES